MYRPMKLIRKLTRLDISSMEGDIRSSRQSLASGHLDIMWISRGTLWGCSVGVGLSSGDSSA